MSQDAKLKIQTFSDELQLSLIYKYFFVNCWIHRKRYINFQLKKSMISKDYEISQLQRDSMPVSYTHLDVYKRQIQS